MASWFCMTRSNKESSAGFSLPRSHRRIIIVSSRDVVYSSSPPIAEIDGALAEVAAL